MSYRVFNLDMTTLNTDKVQIIPPGQRIGEVFSITFPAGATLGLAFGSGDAITVDRPFSFAPDDDETANNGLFYTVPVAQPGVSLAVIVSTVSGLAPAVG